MAFWNTRPAAWPLGAVVIVASLHAAHAWDVGTRVRTGLGPEPLPETLVLLGDGTKPWQYLTYAFVHGDATHLRSNVLVIAVAGAACEWRLGALGLGAAFLGLCAAVGVGFHAFDARDLYGASGAAAGLVALAATLALTARTRALFVRLVPVALAIAYALATDVVPALRAHPNPGSSAHAVGFVAGCLLGVALARRAPSPGP